MHPKEITKSAHAADSAARAGLFLMNINAKAKGTVVSARCEGISEGRMISRLRWRGPLPAAAVFVVAVAALITTGSADGSSEYWLITPMLISLTVLVVLMWAVGRRNGK